MAGAVPAAKLTTARRRSRRHQIATDQNHIVLGLYHDPEHPELDLWEEGRGTPGDRNLAGIGRDLGVWLQENYGIRTRVIPYQLEDGGIYLKDAACMAGIGSMGKNNLVLVPGYGPRVRFRAVWVDLTFPGKIPSRQDSPCAGCAGYCIRACPMDAFAAGGTASGAWRGDADSLRQGADRPAGLNTYPEE